jgi:hypothetical protein
MYAVRAEAGPATSRKMTMRCIARITLPSILLLMAASMSARAVEEPSYRVIRKIGEIEVREYSGYVAAQVQVAGPAASAGNRAFPILAGYIFGGNKGARKLAMTAPVTQTAAPVKMPMTAPVTQSPANGGYLVQFVLPADVTLANAPEPNDPRVSIREVPAKRVAAIRYSGLWSDANYEQHLTELQQALRAANQPWSGEPIYSRYNAPFMPWFLRRNEIWLPLP